MTKDEKREAIRRFKEVDARVREEAAYELAFRRIVKAARS